MLLGMWIVRGKEVLSAPYHSDPVPQSHFFVLLFVGRIERLTPTPCVRPQVPVSKLPGPSALSQLLVPQRLSRHAQSTKWHSDHPEMLEKCRGTPKIPLNEKCVR